VLQAGPCQTAQTPAGRDTHCRDTAVQQQYSSSTVETPGAKTILENCTTTPHFDYATTVDDDDDNRTTAVANRTSFFIPSPWILIFIYIT
jgi:hypothetical protein